LGGRVLASLDSGKQEANMATGMFRTPDGSVQVDYDGTNIPISRSKYETNGYKPDFDKLPLEAEYWPIKKR
jgi:hypothetical protein